MKNHKKKKESGKNKTTHVAGESMYRKKSAGGAPLTDIKKDASKTVRNKSVTSFEKKIAKTRGKTKPTLVGLATIALAVVAGTALAWFATTQLLRTTTPLLALLPVSTSSVVIHETETSGSEIMDAIPGEYQDMIDEFTKAHGIQDDTIQAVFGARGAIGFASSGKKASEGVFCVLKRSATLDEHVARLTEGKEGNVEDGEMIELVSEGSKDPLFLIQTEEWILVAEQQDLMKSLIDTTNGTAMALSSDAKAKSAFRAISGKGDLLVFLRPAISLQNIGDAIPQPLSSDVLFQEDTVLTLAIAPREGGIGIEVFAPISTEGRGSGGDLLAFIPASVQFAFQGSNIEHSWIELEERFARQDSDQILKFSQAKEHIEEQTGFRLEDALLRRFIGSVLFISSKDENGEESFALVAETEEGQNEAFLEDVEGQVEKRYAREKPIQQEFILEDGTVGRELVPDVAAFTFADVKEDGVRMRTIQDPNGNGGVTHAQLGTILIISSTESLARDILLAAQQGTGIRPVLYQDIGQIHPGDDVLYLNMEQPWDEKYGSLFVWEERVRGGVEWHGFLKNE